MKVLRISFHLNVHTLGFHHKKYYNLQNLLDSGTVKVLQNVNKSNSL